MPTTYPTSAMSKLPLMTDRHLQRLVATGVVPQAERGRFELAPAVQGYIRYLRDRGAGQSADGEGDARVEWQKARARRARVLADRMEEQVLDRQEADQGAVEIRRCSVSRRFARSLGPRRPPAGAFRAADRETAAQTPPRPQRAAAARRRGAQKRQASVPAHWRHS